MASPWGWGQDETTSVTNNYNTFIAGGPTGAAGPAGTTLGFTQNDRQGRAALQTSADADNTTGGLPVNGAAALALLSGLSPVYYTTDINGDPPYRTPITQASILSVLQTFADGYDELGPFEVDGLASGTGTIELESLAGFLVAAVQGLGFQPTQAARAGVLQSEGSLTYTGASGAMTLRPTSLLGTFNDSPCVAVQGGNDPLVGMTSATEPLDVSYLKPRELSLSATGDQGQTTCKVDFLGGDGTEARLTLAVGDNQTVVLQANGEFGAAQLLIGNGSKTAILADGNAGLLVNDAGETPIFHAHTDLAQVSIDNALFSVARISQPADTFTIPPEAVSKAFIVAINDVSSPVSVVLPVGVPSGTLVSVKKETVDTTNDVTVSVDTGGTIDGISTAVLSLSYQYKGFYFAGGTAWFTT